MTTRSYHGCVVFPTSCCALFQDCIQVESRYGSSVYSYFAFFRWLVLQSILASFIALGFFLVHLSKGSYSLTATVGSYMPECVVGGAVAVGGAPSS